MKNVEIKWVEKSTAGGRYDMVISYTDSETLMVVELKKGEINIDALNQLSGYLTNNESEENNGKYQYGLLVGTSISSEVKTIISKEKNIYAIVLSRFSQGAQEYVYTTMYKPQDSKYSKDYAKYTLTNLQGEKNSNLGKGNLSYEIIKSYIRKDENRTCSDVQKEFADIIKRGALEIVIENNLPEDNIRRIRYFKEHLQCSDYEVIICNQWGEGNIYKMIDRATRLGMTIEY